jgi:hypothetical protein
MPGSSEKINYSLRPAKQIERKMLCESFWHLWPFASPWTYRYVGFGSFYFTDFSLFHKCVGISNMVSIEGDKSVKKERFIDNLPFKCIDIRFGMSDRLLPKLEWDGVRTILWLDYDEPLETTDVNIFGDVSLFFGKACAGSMLLLTLDADPESDEEDESLTRLKKLKRDIGEYRVPIGTTEADLDGWGRAKIYREIVNNEIDAAVQKRNSTRSPGTRFRYQQLFNFHYKDSAMMLTLGYFLYDEGTIDKFKACGFDRLSFYRPAEEVLRIEVPKLTYRELRNLNRQLPISPGEKLSSQSIPGRDLELYEKVYRWFPTFAEAEL